MSTLGRAARSEASPPGRARRRRRLGIAAAVVRVLALPFGVAAAVSHLGLPWWMEDGDRNHRYEGEAGALRYQVHLPPRHDGTTALPVVMAIHGCARSGYGWNSMKSTTQLNDLADREGFTRRVVAEYGADPDHVHVAGASSGAGVTPGPAP